MRKSRLQVALAWTIIGAATVWSVYDWIFVDEGLHYFSADWFRVLVLLAIVVIGTPVLLGFESLSADRKRRVTLWVVGLLATGATGFAIHFLFSTIRLTGSLSHAGGLWLPLLATLFPCIIAACLWLGFARILNRKPV